MRNPLFDIMKFVAIIAMIIGHCLFDGRKIYIYAWHMPLFFIISGYFFKPQPILYSVKNNGTRYVKPYIIISILTLIIALLSELCDLKNNFWQTATILAIGGNGLSINEYDLGFPTWFLIAVFITATTYSLLHKYIHNIYILTLAVLSITIIGYFMPNIPFDIPQACVGLTFYHIGYIFKKYGDQLHPKAHIYAWLCVAIFFYIASCLYGGLEMYGHMYPNLAINIAGAIGATFIISQLSYYFLIIAPRFANIIAQIGSISILILITHTFDMTFNIVHNFVQFISFFTNIGAITILCHILFALTISLLLYRIPTVRRVFRLSKHQYIDIKTSKS